MNKTYLLFALLFILTAVSCRKDYYGVKQVDQNKIVHFSTDIQPIFSTNCAKSGCHVAGGETPDLTPDNAYNGLMNGLATPDDSLAPENTTLYKMLTSTTKPMPPAGKLTSYDINLVVAWIKQGAQNN
jgi:hypothetical protein